MVLGGVDGVNTDGVGVDLLEIWNVSLAGVGVGQRIVVRLLGRIAGRVVRASAAGVVLLVCDTTNVAACPLEADLMHGSILLFSYNWVPLFS